MQLHNDQGTRVDAVPFLVVVTGGFLVLYSSVPGYLLELGVALEPALVVTTALFVCTAVVAYRQFVLRARPAVRAEVPVVARLKRLLYAALIGVALGVLSLLPLLAVR